MRSIIIYLTNETIDVFVHRLSTYNEDLPVFFISMQVENDAKMTSKRCFLS